MGLMVQSLEAALVFILSRSATTWAVLDATGVVGGH